MEWKRTVQPDAAAELALLERCKRQDAEAFGRFVDVYQNRLFGFVRRMVNDAEEAADITQDAFIRAFQAIHRFDGRCSVRTWLFRIAYNLCVDRARKVDRTPNEFRLDHGYEDDETVELADVRWDPENIVMNDEFFELVEKGVASMSEKLRSVLLLHDKEDLSYDEIAETLGIPVGTVKSRLFLARNHLQSVVGEYLRGESHVS